MATNDTIFAFRPTRQTPQGGDIHNDRRLVACRFLEGSCYGMVNGRFQEAFQDLVHDLTPSFFQNISRHRISTVGHSVGGSLQLFMAVYLYQKYNIAPSYVIGFAGPFIGDKLFTETYIDPLKEQLGPNMWQIETIDLQNMNNYDATVEQYNVNNGNGEPNWGAFPFNPMSPFRPSFPTNVTVNTPIFIYEEDLCGVYITPLPNTYGMHDLKNYRSAFQGTLCV
jgi:hypothetical protein